MLCFLRSSKFRPARDLSPDLYDAGAVLYQLSYQANWEQVIMWVHDKPIDSEFHLNWGWKQFQC